MGSMKLRTRPAIGSAAGHPSAPPPDRRWRARRCWRRRRRSGAPPSRSRRDVNRAARDQILALLPISPHVRRGDVSAQRLRARPRFEHGESIRPELGLERADAVGVDMGRVFDAAVFRPHIGDVGLKYGQKLIPEAGLGGKDGDDADHFGSRFVVRGFRGRGRGLHRRAGRSPSSPRHD